MRARLKEALPSESYHERVIIQRKTKKFGKPRGLAHEKAHDMVVGFVWYFSI